jgi:hypothetical protein
MRIRPLLKFSQVPTCVTDKFRLTGIGLHQRVPGPPNAVADQPQQEVFGTNVVADQHARLLPGKHYNLPRTVRKPLKHPATLPAAVYLDATTPARRGRAPCEDAGGPSP